MNVFFLPDLGEGLPDAEIHEWFVKEGDTVKADQPLVAMETAKAVVEVPCPHDGVIAKCHGKVGDVIKTGDALVSFESTQEKRPDQGTVVGNLEELHEYGADEFIIGAATSSNARAKATPAVRAYAKTKGIDLNSITARDSSGFISKADIDKAWQTKTTLMEGFEPLRGVRRAMLTSMVQSHEEVVPVSIFDEVDIGTWSEGTDITIRLIRALEIAVQKEPSLNAWFDTAHQARRCFDELHLGLAMDSEEGLFVPVLHNVMGMSDDKIRQQINQFKTQVAERNIPSEQLKGATFTLSNFGKFAGRFASPIIVPPQTAILAVGKKRMAVVAKGDTPVVSAVLPLSLSFDHRAITGGEATRFLGVVIEELSKT